jgi:hypothetical protein
MMTVEEWFKQIETRICPLDLCRANEFVDFIFKGISNSLDNLLDNDRLMCIYYHDYLNKTHVLDGYSKVDIEMIYINYMINEKLKEYGWMAQMRFDQSKGVLYDDNIIREDWGYKKSKPLKNVENPNHIDIYWSLCPI